MASERVDWVVRVVDSWNAGDVDGFMAALGPDFEFTPDPSFPDADTYRGEELERWMREWARTWGENRLQLLEISEEADRVLFESRWHLAIRQTGDPVPLSDFYVVVWFDRGQPRRAAAFFDRALAEAAAAAG